MEIISPNFDLAQLHHNLLLSVFCVIRRRWRKEIQTRIGSQTLRLHLLPIL
jgi:hypothetical protein